MKSFVLTKPNNKIIKFLLVDSLISFRNFNLSEHSKKMLYNDRALCRCGIRIPSARNCRLAFDKDKYLEPMFGDVGQARTNAAMLILMIDTASSRTCTKPIVIRCHAVQFFSYQSFWYKKLIGEKRLHNRSR